MAESKKAGELAVAASVNGRRLSLDAISTRMLAVEARHVESLVPCGFRVNWIEGKSGETPVHVEFDLCSGAGVGSGWLTLSVKLVDADGEVLQTRYECVDMAQVVGAWVDAVRSDLHAERDEASGGQ